jgi:hypothetical protein
MYQKVVSGTSSEAASALSQGERVLRSGALLLTALNTLQNEAHKLVPEIFQEEDEKK